MTDKINFTPDYGEKATPSSTIKVIGIGGGGSNAVKHMYSEGIVGVDFLICNTDRGHLEKTPVPDKLLLGPGLGAGAKPEVARQYALESKDKIQEFIGKDTKMLFITAGMGKGTGTGASPVVAEIAHDMGILTVGVVTTPFRFEGKPRIRQAEEGIAELSKHVDSLITIKNENVMKFYRDDDVDAAYGYADDVLKNAVKCIAELITVDSIQNVDFHDIESIMKDSHKAMLGLAEASGENRVEKVVEEALNCPLLDVNQITGAKNFLFFVSYGPAKKLKISELQDLTDKFDALKTEDTEVIYGRSMDESLGESIRLSVIVTNFNTEAQETVIEKEKNVIITNEVKQTENKQDPVILNDLNTIPGAAVEWSRKDRPYDPVQNPAVAAGPSRIDDDVIFDIKFGKKEDFSTPAINRYGMKEYSVQTETATHNPHPLYEEMAYDKRELFSDLAD